MKKIKLGILGTADIAFRRFLPALKECREFEYVGVASRNIINTEPFIREFGGKGYGSYDELLEDKSVDAVYIPLPPALHFEWAKKALEKGKHVFLEKPFTTSLSDTEKLIEIAIDKNVALHENYMFQFHSQLKKIIDKIDSGEIGDIRLYRIAFGFPKRADNDFRYKKELGGGALLDCGGYTVKLASILLGESAKIISSKLNYTSQYDVDLFGNATMENKDGITAQISFGMDNSYKCELEVWGSTGNIFADRIFTAPPDFNPQIIIEKENKRDKVILDIDNQFIKSMLFFGECIKNDIKKKDNYKIIKKQSALISTF